MSLLEIFKRSEVNLLIIALTFRFGVNLGKKKDTIDSYVFSLRIITEFFKYNLFAMIDIAQDKLNKLINDQLNKTRDLFLESPGNISGPKSKIQIKVWKI